MSCKLVASRSTQSPALNDHGSGADPTRNLSVASTAGAIASASTSFARQLSAERSESFGVDESTMSSGGTPALSAAQSAHDCTITSSAPRPPDPHDDVARRGLFDALDGKVALLEQTVSLIDAERVLEAPAARSQD